MPSLGARLKRADDPRPLSGRGQYVDDRRLPRMTRVPFVLSPEEALAPILADELGVPADSGVGPPRGTAVVPYAAGTWASRGMPIGGGATLLDARALRDKARCLAPPKLEAHEEDIVVDSGWPGVRGSPDRAVVQLDAETGRIRVREYVAVGNGGQLVTGKLMHYAVPPAAERVRPALRPSRHRQAGDPA